MKVIWNDRVIAIAERLKEGSIERVGKDFINYTSSFGMGQALSSNK